MTRWTPTQYEEYLRTRSTFQGNQDPWKLLSMKADDGKESRLQSRCEAWLKQKGYPYFHDRSRGKNQPGMLDLICFLPEGRTVIIELKAKGGRLSKEQLQTMRMLKYLKHEVYEVRSWKAFMGVMENEI